MRQITPKKRLVKQRLREALQLAGSTYKLAEYLKVSQGTVWKASAYGTVSVPFAVRLEKWSGGKFPAWELRPDYFDPPASPASSPELSTAFQAAAE